DETTIAAGQTDTRIPYGAPVPAPPVEAPTASGSYGGHPAVSRLELRAMQRARRRRNTTRNGLLIGAVALLTTVGLAAFLLWPQSDDTRDQAKDGGKKAIVNTGTAQAASAPQAGPPLALENTELEQYTIAAVKAGIEEKDGKKYPYMEYILTNGSAQPETLEQPGDLFVRRDKQSDENCMTQPGADGAYCSVKNTTRVVAYLDGSAPPTIDSGEEYFPGGASYLLRVTGDEPVSSDASPTRDFKLYVWQVRFFTDRKARLVALP
ncbi:hypothetical protein, partial [Actinocorallia lasiicapitis]